MTKKIIETPIKKTVLNNKRVRTRSAANLAIRGYIAEHSGNKCSMARKLGCTRSYVGQITGKRLNLTLDTLSDIATSLGARVKIELVPE